MTRKQLPDVCITSTAPLILFPTKSTTVQDVLKTPFPPFPATKQQQQQHTKTTKKWPPLAKTQKILNKGTLNKHRGPTSGEKKETPFFLFLFRYILREHV